VRRLAPNFICVANLDPRDRGQSVVAGNQKVLAARVSDAKFFWEQDLKVPLEDQAKKLDQIVFHEKLGTVADKVERVAKLARWLVEEGIVNADCTPAKAGVQESAAEGLDPGRSSSRASPQAASKGRGTGAGDPNSARPERSRGATDGTSEQRPSTSLGTSEELAQMAYDAARLAKADLVTGMVGEFPELQGVMGGYYARAQGHPPQVADAIRDHYKPVGQGDEVPTAPVTVAVSLADKLDTLCLFFDAGMPPSGSKDPFSLRRAGLAIIALLVTNSVRKPLANLILKALSEPLDFSQRIETQRILPFLIDRLKVQQREAGVRHDLIDAVFALGGEDDLVRLLARVKALQAFVETPEGRDLLAGYKRAANILKKEGYEPSPLVGEGWVGDGEPSGSPQGLSSTADAAGPHPSPPHKGEGVVQGIPQTGEEDPLAGLEDLRDALLPNSLSYSPEPAEQSLAAALDSAEPRARTAVEREDFEGAMAALASLRGPVDAFFEQVTVNDADPAKRAARLALLARVRDAVHQVADFSRIEG
jgi:glycyl-tRNA synthetase beta chain